MNKLASPLQTPTLRIDESAQAVHSFHRLIVLIPDDSDHTAAVRRVWELAHASGAHILLLSLCKDSAEESSLRRRLVRMASLLQDGHVTAEWKVDFGPSWVETVKRNSSPGDMIVCFAEQRAGVWHRPLSQILQSNLRNPVYVLAGFAPQNLPGANRLSQLLAWAGSIAIILGLFLLQIQIMSLAEDGMQTTLLILSVIPEFWLIWAWNNLFS